MATGSPPRRAATLPLVPSSPRLPSPSCLSWAALQRVGWEPCGDRPGPSVCTLGAGGVPALPLHGACWTGDVASPRQRPFPRSGTRPPYRHSHLAMVTPLTMHRQSTWAGRRGQHCSRPPRLWVSPPPSHPAVAVGEPVPAKHRLPGPSASPGTGRHTGVGRWRRIGALPWGQPLSHVPSPWSRPGH